MIFLIYFATDFFALFTTCGRGSHFSNFPLKFIIFLKYFNRVFAWLSQPYVAIFYPKVFEISKIFMFFHFRRISRLQIFTQNRPSFFRRTGSGPSKPVKTLFKKCPKSAASPKLSAPNVDHSSVKCVDRFLRFSTFFKIFFA